MAVGANPNLTVVFKADLRQLNRALRDAKKRVSEYADALSRLGKSDLIPPQVIQKLDHYNKAVSNASREITRARTETESFSKSVSEAKQPLKVLQEELVKTADVAVTQSIRIGRAIAKATKQPDRYAADRGIIGGLVPPVPRWEVSDIQYPTGGTKNPGTMVLGSRMEAHKMRNIADNSAEVAKANRAYLEGFNYIKKYSTALVLVGTKGRKAMSDVEKATAHVNRTMAKSTKVYIQDLNTRRNLWSRLGRVINKVVQPINRVAKAQTKLTREVQKFNEVRSRGKNNLWSKYTSAAEIQRAQALNQSTKAYRRSGMAMTQFAYAIDDAQYGLRGIQNNLQQMLVVMGASGPIIIMATAAIVGLNHAFREFDFKAWINSFRDLNKQIARLERTAVRKAHKQIFDETTKITAAFQILKEEGNSVYFDDMAKGFDHVTDSITGSNKELKQMEAMLLNISSIEISRALIKGVESSLSNWTARVSKEGSKLGMPGIGAAGITLVSEAYGELLGSGMTADQITEKDIFKKILPVLQEKTVLDIAETYYPDYYEPYQYGAGGPGTLAPGSAPMSNVARTTEQQVADKQVSLAHYISSVLKQVQVSYREQGNLLRRSPTPGVSDAGAGSSASEGASLYEIFRSQSAHELALMKEYGASQTEILNKRKLDLSVAKMLVATAEEELEVSRAIQMNNAQISRDTQLQEVKRITDYHSHNIKLLRAQQKPQSEILRAEREQAIAVRDIATNLEECRRLKEQIEDLDLRIDFAESSEAIKEMNKDLRVHLAGLASANKIFAIQNEGEQGAALESARRELEYAREKAKGMRDIYGADSEQYYMASLEVDEKKAAYDSLSEGAKAAKEFNLQLRLGAVLGQSLGRVFEAIGAGESLTGVFDAGMVAIGDMLQNLGKAALAQGLVIKAMESWNPIAIIAAGIGAIALGGLIKGKFKGSSGARSFGGRSGGGYGGSGFTPSMSSGDNLGRLSYNPMGMDIRISGEDLRIVGAVNNDNNGAYIP